MVTALKALRSNEAFKVVLNFIKAEIARIDVQNRNIGFENKTSEAKGFADFVDYVTACQAPEADRDQAAVSEAERQESAQTLM